MVFTRFQQVQDGMIRTVGYGKPNHRQFLSLYQMKYHSRIGCLHSVKLVIHFFSEPPQPTQTPTGLFLSLIAIIPILAIFPVTHTTVTFHFTMITAEHL